MGEWWRPNQKRINDLLERIPVLERVGPSAEFKPGHMQIYVGPMFSEKSAELIRKLRKAELHHVRVIAFKPYTDTRSPSNVIHSRLIGDYPCIPIPADRPDEMIAYIDGDTQMIGIEEPQFFAMDDPSYLADVTVAFRRRKRHLVLTALSTDFTGAGFPVTQVLLTSGTPYIKAMTAACTFPGCSDNAVYSQRFIDGTPVLTGEKVQIESPEIRYEPRCISHFEPPKNG